MIKISSQSILDIFWEIYDLRLELFLPWAEKGTIKPVLDLISTCDKTSEDSAEKMFFPKENYSQHWFLKTDVGIKYPCFSGWFHKQNPKTTNPIFTKIYLGNKSAQSNNGTKWAWNIDEYGFSCKNRKLNSFRFIKQRIKE